MGTLASHDALTFARRTEIERLVLFHHDPLHTDDFLDGFRDTALERWEAVGGRGSARTRRRADRAHTRVGSRAGGELSGSPELPRT